MGRARVLAIFRKLLLSFAPAQFFGPLLRKRETAGSEKPLRVEIAAIHRFPPHNTFSVECRYRMGPLKPLLMAPTFCVFRFLLGPVVLLGAAWYLRLSMRAQQDGELSCFDQTARIFARSSDDVSQTRNLDGGLKSPVRSPLSVVPIVARTLTK
jgi:hypothetical protein